MKPFTTVTVVVLSLISLVQLTRVALGWAVTIDGVAIPLWASVIACVVSAALAFMLWRESRG